MILFHFLCEKSVEMQPPEVSHVPKNRLIVFQKTGWTRVKKRASFSASGFFCISDNAAYTLASR